MTATGAAPPAVGERAPELVLPDQRGELVRLSEVVADRHALVVFFPFAFSSICTGELLDIQLNIDEFVNDKVQVLAVSCDSTYSLRAWAAHEGYRFPLLSDFWPHGRAARDWGVFDETSGRARRGTFLVDPSQTVRWSLQLGTGQTREVGVLHRAVRDL
ncbi:peroxiredoxin [Ornithinimicrobium sufpigmenti]|uniref:peroxiredoxin n=1 Tax=Ornithinimicrobium sufpigmenti TaxID=2508882 RepID=UPI00103570DD|nr:MULTISPECIES: peroxiredoxin [unclassified Ornithinimicrobium]